MFNVMCLSPHRVFSCKESGQGSRKTEQPTVPELVLSLIRLPEEKEKPITDLSQPWAALVLLPHVRLVYYYLNTHL